MASLVSLTACGKSGDDRGLSAGQSAAAKEAAARELKKVSAAELQAFADGFKLDGYKVRPPVSISEAGARFNLEGPTRDNGAGSRVAMTYSSCLNIGCGPVTLDDHKQTMPAVRNWLSESDLQNPELVVDLFETKVGNHTVMGTYVLSATIRKDADGGVSRGMTNRVKLTWRHDKHLVDAEASANDWSFESQKELAERTSREFLEGEAKRALEVAMKLLER